MKPAISVHNLSKKYRLGVNATRDNNLTENIRFHVSNVWDKIHRLIHPNKELKHEESFWALQDVSFEVQAGEVVGIIGRNGAGKSTLLKVLSQIVEPTSGHAVVHGRMGSLLEVGTGFHAELTGRENIYLNGAILGMSREEINKKFAEIVAFAEVEKFLDTPVKRYSSGMYVRLAFSVAAHLEPEILIVDEVLAVGDATFQKRCTDKMSTLARNGKTILFVSHNLQMVSLLCKRAVRLDHGRVTHVGTSSTVIQDFLNSTRAGSETGQLQDKQHTGDGRARFIRAWLVNNEGQPECTFISGKDLRIRIEIETKEHLPDVAAAVILTNQYGVRIVTSWTKEANYQFSLKPGRTLLDCTFQKLTLRPGHSFCVNLWLSDGEVMDSIENAIYVDVLRNDNQANWSPDAAQGIVLVEYTWESVLC